MERAKARQTVKRLWQLQEAANRALNTDTLLLPMVEDRAKAVGKVMVAARASAMEEVKAAARVAAMEGVKAAVTVAATVEATAAQSKRK
jgi:glycine cleavage system H lipoate-binding protein